MKTGKLSGQELEEIILTTLNRKRDDVLVYPAVGEDCAVIDFGEEVLIVSTDPITGAVAGIGRLAVNISCNDIAASGGEPVGIQLLILAPPSLGKSDLTRIMTDVELEAARQQIDVLGGHTEVTSAVNQLIISTTAIGRAPRNRYVAANGARPGDDILITKGIGLEGAAILALDHKEELLKRGVSKDTIEKAGSYLAEMSVVAEGLLCAEFGVHAMHDVTEGGLLGGVWELAYAAGLGFELERAAIPVLRPVAEICQKLGLDPLLLISSGTMLVVTDQGKELQAVLKAGGIEAAIIGQMREDGYILHDRGTSKQLKPPFQDELWRWLGR
ncbi:MAG: AIR synthase family protein [Halanaerobium sp.]|nr:AIR synthase family protein [Halanaerobium sp.]